MSNTLTKQKQHRFISKQHNYQLWIEQPRDLRDENGRKYGQTPLKAVEFAENQYTADEAEAERLGMTFDELVKWIQEHPEMNTSIWDEGTPPEAQSPTVKEQSEAIFAAVRKLDPDAIAALMDDERATHNRQAVLQVATVALEQLQGEGESEKK